MKFPDSSVNAILLLALAGLATGIAGTGLEALLGEQTEPWAQTALLALAFFVGFGAVYAPYAITAYRESNTTSGESVR